MKIRLLLLLSILLAVSCGEGGNNNPLLDRLFVEIAADRDSVCFGENTDIVSESFSIVNSSLRTLEWRLEYSCPWISVANPGLQGVLESNKSENITIDIDRNRLNPGYNFAYIEILSVELDKSSKIKVSASGYVEPPEESLPLLNTLEPSEISSDKVTLHGEVVNPGYPEYTERGFVISGTEHPVIGEPGVDSYKALINDDALFSVSVKLSPFNTYFVRAYATNALGTAYGNDISFTTPALASEVMTMAVSDIASTSATLNGTVTERGVPEYSERGFCYTHGDNPNPVITDNKLFVSGSGAGEFSYSIDGLEIGKNYYVRAYVIQDRNVIYGDAVQFTTVFNGVSVSTSEVTDVGATSATFNGMIANEGTPPYSEKGFCYSKEPNNTPDIDDNKIIVDGTGEGSYSCEVNDLELNTTYFVRAYAIQNGNVVYGEAKQFSTLFENVSVSTSSVSNVSFYSATFNGNIIKEGIPSYSEKGFCYSVEPETSPDMSDNVVTVNGGGAGKFIYDIDGLSPRTTYYVRAYAVQNGEIVYGEIVSFTTTFSKTDIVTLEPSEIDIYYAVVNAGIASVGAPPYTERGFCYSTYPDNIPDINDNRTPVSGSGIAGEYTCTLNGLARQTTYYVRAYAVQDGNVVYGNTVNFTTVWETASVTNYGTSNQSLGTIQLNAGIVNQGYPKYTEKGFVYMTMDALEWAEAGGPEFEPTILDGRTPVVSGTTGTGSYSLRLTGVNGNIVCGFRPYLIQGGEPVYGETEYFLSYSLPEVTTYSISGDKDNPSRAQLNGMVDWQGNPAYTETGFAVSFEDSLPEIGSPGVATVKAQASEGTLFASIVTGIPEGRTIYVRAYAKSQIGIAYGKVLTYTSKAS